ncbi:unnamed protein product [Microthlaspi erraticum]|uniref:Uncharacterized protein n=1 Tax=Microthlaspi erraticum TaxID=1685480 RepID=A0A6D2KYM0_9BRAS|nr:unnamed protein product [Microthlaspi erraticum]
MALDNRNSDGGFSTSLGSSILLSDLLCPDELTDLEHSSSSPLIRKTSNRHPKMPGKEDWPLFFCKEVA